MNTKKIRLISLFTLLICFLTSFVIVAQNRQIKASSKYITKNASISNFDQIKLLGSPTLEYIQSSGKPKLEITGSDNLVDLIEYEVSNNVLTVKFKNNTNISMGTSGRLKVTVSSPSLKAATLQGSGDILLTTVQSRDLDLTLIGSGDIVADKITCSNSFSASLQGSGDISIKNNVRAENATLKLIGSGDLVVADISAKSATATLQGSGDLKVNGISQTATVNIQLTGSGDLSFQNIHATEVNAGLQGAGDMELSGSAVRTNLTLSSSGEINAQKLKADNVTAKVGGSGEISCSASKSLKADIQGSGEIRYSGNPSDIQATGKKNLRRI